MKYRITMPNGTVHIRNFITDPYTEVAVAVGAEAGGDSGLEYRIRCASDGKNRDFVEKTCGIKIEPI